MTFKPYLTVILSAALLALPVSAHARGTADQTKATLAGAAAGAAVGAVLGKDTTGMLIGAAGGALAGNAYAYHNKKMNQAESRGHGRYKLHRGSWKKHHRRHHH